MRMKTQSFSHSFVSMEQNLKVKQIKSAKINKNLLVVACYFSLVLSVVFIIFSKEVTFGKDFGRKLEKGAYQTN